MAHVRKGQLARTTEWWKHLRKPNRRMFWKRERLAEKQEIQTQLGSGFSPLHCRDDNPPTPPSTPAGE